MKKVLYVLSDIDKALAFEWIAEHLDNKKFELSFILLANAPSHLEGFLDEQGIPVRRIAYQTGWRLIFPFLKLWWILLKARPDIIHTHLRYATLLGISAGFMAGVRNRVHTRHHSTSNHKYYPHAVKSDRLVSLFSSKIVSISDVVGKVLVRREGVPSEKIVKIPHGFDLSYFENVDEHRIQDLRETYLPSVSGPVIGIISRYLELKGVEYGIEAFKLIREKYPSARLVLANAQGPYQKVIDNYLAGLPIDSYIEIPFENELNALYKLFDVFLHLPISEDVEAFGQTYIEALAAGVPSVFTISGIAGETIQANENAIVVPYRDSEAVASGVLRILGDDDLRDKLAINGRKTAESFDLKTFISRLERLYQSA